MSKCMICDETFNKSTRAHLECLYCNFDACRSCCQTYLLDQNVAKCMNTACGKEWPRKFLVAQFPKNFINGAWKDHREKVLMEKELALLPATQIVVEEEIRKEKLQEEMNLVDQQLREMQAFRHNLHRMWLNGGDVVSVGKNTRSFVRACSGDDCRGFLSSQWKCGLCETFACSQCFVIIGKDRDAPHECLADDLATAQLLKSDTKPCPCCASSIFKIEGCDQMWCTQCHTAFSWRTGHIETNVHNPHFYEWQRRNGGVARAPGDFQCGRELNHRLQSTMGHGNGYGVLKPKTLEYTNMFYVVSNIIRSVLHLQQSQLPRYQVDPVENNVLLRVQYMRKIIDKDTFQTRIQRDNKKHGKKREMFEVINLFIHMTTDILFRFRELSRVTTTTEEVLKDTLAEVEQIRLYVNECLIDVSHTYGAKPKSIQLFKEGENQWNVLI